MFSKIIHFIKYHNAFTVILILVLLGGTAVLADEDVRDKVIGQAKLETQGIDNTVLLAADLENFDFGLQISQVNEDEDNYYVAYNFQTLAIQDNVWQTVIKQEILKVDKKDLGERDLGLYAAEELSEVIEAQSAYLKEIQEREQKKGQTLVKQTTLYTGLIGLVLDPKTKELPGYEPVVQSEEPESEALTDRAKIIPQAVSEALAKQKAAQEQAKKAQFLPQTLTHNPIGSSAGGSANINQGDAQLTIPPNSGSLIDQPLISEPDFSADSDQGLTDDPAAQEPIEEPSVQEPTCQPEQEICDGQDNDCDKVIDEDDVCEPAVPEPAPEPEPEPAPAPEPPAPASNES